MVPVCDARLHPAWPGRGKWGSVEANERHKLFGLPTGDGVPGFLSWRGPRGLQGSLDKAALPAQSRSQRCGDFHPCPEAEPAARLGKRGHRQRQLKWPGLAGTWARAHKSPAGSCCLLAHSGRVYERASILGPRAPPQQHCSLPHPSFLGSSCSSHPPELSPPSLALGRGRTGRPPILAEIQLHLHC